MDRVLNLGWQFFNYVIHHLSAFLHDAHLFKLRNAQFYEQLLRYYQLVSSISISSFLRKAQEQNPQAHPSS